jgi:hypothetical protein
VQLQLGILGTISEFASRVMEGGGGALLLAAPAQSSGNGRPVMCQRQ